MNFQTRAFIIGGVTVLFMVLVFVWMVILDKSTIAVSGEGIYEIAISGEGIKGTKTVVCAENPCEISVPTGKYTLIMTRTGYQEEQRIVNTERGATQTVSVEFHLIPAVTEIGLLNEAEASIQASFSPKNLSELFSIDMDPEFNKQRLNFHDESTKTWKIWAYFDRTLDEPKVFPSPDLKRALVLGGNDLYLVDGEKLERSFVGNLANIDSIQWSPDTPWVLARVPSEKDAAFWFINLEDGTMKEWPFGFDANKVVWVAEGKLVFATKANVSTLVNQDAPSSIDVLKSLLNGSIQTESGAFEFGEYDVVTDRTLALDNVSKESEVNYSSVSLGVEGVSGRVFFTDETRVFEVIR